MIVNVMEKCYCQVKGQRKPTPKKLSSKKSPLIKNADSKISICHHTRCLVVYLKQSIVKVRIFSGALYTSPIVTKVFKIAMDPKDGHIMSHNCVVLFDF